MVQGDRTPDLRSSQAVPANWHPAGQLIIISQSQLRFPFTAAVPAQPITRPELINIAAIRDRDRVCRLIKHTDGWYPSMTIDRKTYNSQGIPQGPKMSRTLHIVHTHKAFLLGNWIHWNERELQMNSEMLWTLMCNNFELLYKRNVENHMKFPFLAIVVVFLTFSRIYFQTSFD